MARRRKPKPPTRLQRLVAFARARSTETSSWRGLTLVATACGAKFAPDMQEAIVVAGLALAGVIGVMFPDKGAE